MFCCIGLISVQDWFSFKKRRSGEQDEHASPCFVGLFCQTLRTRIPNKQPPPRVTRMIRHANIWHAPVGIFGNPLAFETRMLANSGELIARGKKAGARLQICLFPLGRCLPCRTQYHYADRLILAYNRDWLPKHLIFGASWKSRRHYRYVSSSTTSTISLFFETAARDPHIINPEY
jgi:hypothetical protein